MEVEWRHTNNIVVWLMDGTVIAQRTNTSAFTSGNLMLGLMDVFPSIAAPARDSFVLYDNIWVETSTNLTTWQPLATLTATNQPLQFTDTNAPAETLRYYRARR